MGKPKTNREDKLRLKREKEQKRYQKIKSDPIKYEKQKEKERLKYLKKKEKGQIKPAAQMTKRSLREKRKRQKVNSKKYRDKLVQNKIVPEHQKQILQNLSSNDKSSIAEIPHTKALQEDYSSTPTSSGLQNVSREEDSSNIPGSTKKKIGRKRIRRDRTKMYKELQKCKLALKKAEQKAEMYKKRHQRLQNKVHLRNNIKSRLNKSPRTQVKNLLQNEVVSPKIKKRLLFAEVVERQLAENYAKLKSDKSKQLFSKLIGGKILKKYRMLHASKHFLQYKRFISSNKRGCKLTYDRKKRADSIPNNIKLEVISFLEEDINSRICPGKKDCLTRNKITKQKRLLNDTMENLYCKYLASHNFKMHYSTFCKLRPFWIHPPKVRDIDTTKCLIHSNTELLVAALHYSKLIRQKTIREITEAVCCDKYQEECLVRQCNNCKHKSIPYLDTNTDEISYLKWINKKEIYTDAKTNQQKKVQKMVKTEITTTKSNICNEFENNFLKYLEHERNIIHQYKTIKELKKNLKNDEVIIHIDFSENYLCKYSEEPQSVHFGGSKQQITLHTAVVYIKEDGELICQCWGTFSESLNHSAAAVWAHLQPVLQDIKIKLAVSAIHIISDSPSNQYRNKTMFYLFLNLKEEFPTLKSATWNYLESGHGKGAPDGVGGVIKQTADRIVAHGNDLANITDVVNALDKCCSNINLATIPLENIAKQQSRLCKKNLKLFSGSLKVHQVCWTSDNAMELIFRKLSCFECSLSEKSCKYAIGELQYDQALQIDKRNSDDESPFMNEKVQNEQLKVGDWIVVKYDNTSYPGEIVEIVSATEIKVSTMEIAGNKVFKWPLKPDILIYPLSDIVKVISQPIPCGSRATTFHFDNF